MSLSRDEQLETLRNRVRGRYRAFEAAHVNDLPSPKALKHKISAANNSPYAEAFPDLAWEFVIQAFVETLASTTTGRNWRLSLSNQSIVNAVQDMIEGACLAFLDMDYLDEKVDRDAYPTHDEAAEMIRKAVAELTKRGFLRPTTTTTLDPKEQRYMITHQCIEHLYLTALGGAEASPYRAMLLNAPFKEVIGLEPGDHLSARK